MQGHRVAFVAELAIDGPANPCPLCGAFILQSQSKSSSSVAAERPESRDAATSRDSVVRRASIMPVNCHQAFMLSSHKTDTHAPNGSASNEHAYDPLLDDRAGNLHRQIRGIRGIPLNRGIFQPDLLSDLPRDARVVRQRCVGLRLRVFRM